MANNPPGVVVPFHKGQTIKILARARSVDSMKEGLRAVANMRPTPANSNGLGDLAHLPHPMNEEVAKAYRLGAQDFVNTMFRDIMSRHDVYTDAGRKEIEWEMANLFFGLSTSVRDCLSVIRCNQSNEFAAADGLSEAMANYLMIAQAQRGTV